MHKLFIFWVAYVPLLKDNVYVILSKSLLSINTLKMPKRTYQPKTRKRAKTHGFRARMSSPGGRNVIKRRRSKQRTKLSA